MKSENNRQIEYKKVCCPFCQSEKVIKKGFRKTQNRGEIQRYFCPSCDKRFVRDDGFFRMRNSERKITLCLDLFYKGISTRKVQEHLQAFYPHNSSNVSIYNWVIKYSKMISKFTDNLKLKVGKELQIDEMQYERRISKFRKGKEVNWFIDSIDTKTRYMVASEYTRARGNKDIKKVLSNAKKKIGKQVKVISSDGFLGYPRAVKNVFGYHNFLRKDIYHNVVNASQGEGFNIMIERLHNNIRLRTKVMRNFHGSVESANAIMKGMEIYYNFIRTHMTLKCCPYELATDLKLKSPNKWLELIQLSNGNN